MKQEARDDCLQDVLIGENESLAGIVEQFAPVFVFFFQAEDGIRDYKVTGVQTCALPISKLLRKESVLAESASWLFRGAPYLIFALTWVAAALVPSFASGLMFNWAADVVALVALLGAARALLALAGMDVGTSFGGIGSSREMMIATLAEPAMMLIVLTLAIAAGTTRLAGVADFFIIEPLAVRGAPALSL